MCSSSIWSNQEPLLLEWLQIWVEFSFKQVRHKIDVRGLRISILRGVFMWYQQGLRGRNGRFAWWISLGVPKHTLLHVWSCSIHAGTSKDLVIPDDNSLYFTLLIDLLHAEQCVRMMQGYDGIAIERSSFLTCVLLDEWLSWWRGLIRVNFHPPWSNWTTNLFMR